MKVQAIVASAVLAGVGLLAGLSWAQAPAPEAPAAAAPYAVDGVHSSAIFRIKHLGVSYTYGRFNDIAGTVAFDDKDPTKASFAVEVKTESVDTHNEKRDQHLRNPDFFNAKQFPTISFKSASVKAAGTDAYDVTGDLTLHGVTKTVTVRIEKTGAGKSPMGGEIIGFESTFSVKRSDYGMTYALEGASDEVRLIVSLEAGRK